MTPFGLKVRELRARKGVSQKSMAKEIGVSAAYLSALEHGHRGIPSWQFIQRIIGYFNIIWDEAEELQALALSSDTRIVVDTTELSADATMLANMLSTKIAFLNEQDYSELQEEINKRAARSTARNS